MAKKRSRPKGKGVRAPSTGATRKPVTRSRKAASALPKGAARRTAGASKRPPPPARQAAALRQRPPGRPQQIEAFFADARHVPDALAEELGESVVLGATSGEDSEEQYERERPEEEGGPFLETSGRTEFAYGVDESNPEDAEPAPWPAVSAGQPPPHRPGGPR